MRRTCCRRCRRRLPRCWRPANCKAPGAGRPSDQGHARPEDQGHPGDRDRARRSRLTVVKITTDQDGLYGYGCATFTQRADLVVPAVEKYLKPFLIGKPADRIDDTWQACYNSSYWRNGPVLNNAISGVDQALWDIKGRQAGHARLSAARRQVPRGRRLLLARLRATISRRRSTSARKFMAQGFRHVRVQVGVPGMAGYGAGRGGATVRRRCTTARYSSRPSTCRRALKLFEECRKQLGDEVELLHDVHERVTPNQAVQFAKELEKFQLFFLEDVLSPEDIAYFRQIRQQCATPIAMGELFNSPHEWTPLIAERLIDYIRIHVSQAGGLTPCRKIAAHGRDLQRAHGLARPWRCLADRPLRQRHAAIWSATTSASRNIRPSTSGCRKSSRAAR